jgi:hypothetical protein
LFSGLMCAGSVVGAVTWGSRIPNLVFFDAALAPAVTHQQSYTLFAQSARWFAGFNILYGIEFVCLVICKLMLLGRLATKAAESSQAEVTEMSGVRQRWLNARALPNVYRVMAGGVVVGSVVGMVSSAVAGVYFVQSAGLYDQAAAACDAAGNDTNSSLPLYEASQVDQTKARTFLTAQSGSEALTLMVVSVAFVLIVSWCVALFRLSELAAARALAFVNDGSHMRPSEVNAARIVADTMQAAAEQRRRMTAACVVVLVTFPARAAFDLLYAYSNFNDPLNPSCGLCDPCQSTSFLINKWLQFTPEFQTIVVAVSSPLPLILSLWLVTKAHARMLLIAADVDRATEQRQSVC